MVRVRTEPWHGVSEWARCKAAEGEDDGSVLPYVTESETR